MDIFETRRWLIKRIFTHVARRCLAPRMRHSLSVWFTVSMSVSVYEYECVLACIHECSKLSLSKAACSRALFWSKIVANSAKFDLYFLAVSVRVTLYVCECVWELCVAVCVKIQIDVDCFVDLFAVAASRLPGCKNRGQGSEGRGRRAKAEGRRGRAKRQMLDG